MPRVTITVPEKTAQPYRFHLDSEVVTLGRGSDNDIAIDSGSVSVKHAEMRRTVGGFELRDAGSTNGIKLGEDRYDVIPLRSGISVKLGDVAFDFILTDEELQVLAKEKHAEEAAALAAAQSVQIVTPDELAKSPRQAPPVTDPHEPHARPSTTLPVNREIGGYGMLLILLLALLAFWVGMSIRFHKDTGRSLMNAIRSNRHATQPPASQPAPQAPAPTPDAPAPAAPSPDVPSPDVPSPDVPSPDVPAPDAPMSPDNAAPGAAPAADAPPQQ